MFLKEEADHFLSFFLEVCIIWAQAAESQELGKRDAGFDTGIARWAVVKVGLRVSRFTVNGCREFSLFQGDVHVQESEGLLWGLEGEFDGGMEVLHKVDEIHKLFVAYLGWAGAVIDVFFVDIKHQFCLFVFLVLFFAAVVRRSKCS